MTAGPQTRSEELSQLRLELDEAHRALQELRAREDRYRQVMETNMVGVLFWHVDGRILEANDQVLEITGYSREDLEQGRVNWLAMTPPEFAEQEAAAGRELAATGVCTPFEKEYIRKDGSRVPILIGGAFLRGSRQEGVCFVLNIGDRKQAEQRLEASQRLFQAFTENSPAIAFMKDAESRRVYMNRRYREVFAQGMNLLGKSDADLFGADVAAALQAEDAQVLRERKAIKTEVRVPTPDGVSRDWLTYKFPIEDEQGRMLIGGVAVDITPLKQAQQELQRANAELEHRVAERTHELHKSETRLRKWLEQSVVPIQVVSPDGRTVQVNPAWERLWGVTFQDMEGRNLLTDSQVEAEGIGAYIRRALAGETVFVPEVPYVPDKGVYAGQARWCRGAIYPVKNDVTGAVEEIVIVHDDVTERKTIEQQLRAEEKVMRNLLDLQEQERKLIAYEIHDGVVQDLIGAQMRLDTFIQTRQPADVGPLTVASELLQKGIGEARRLIGGLRPLVIDEKGLVQAIQYLIAEEEQRGGPAIHFFHRVQFDRLPSLVEGTLFRIVQECITNARRHSGSPEVEIWLQQEQNRLTIRVRDYGCGFDLAAVPEGCFGLEGIRSRAQIFGGKSWIDTHLGEGTTVRVEIPLE